MSDLTGRVALVTGAGRGIGLAIARRLAERGAELLLVARTTDELEAARKVCREAGAPSVRVANVNLTDRNQLERLCHGAAGELDVLVNNAGVARSAPLERTNDEVWDTSMELNAHAPFALCRAVLPAMVRRGRGRVVNVASTAGLRGYAYTSAYVASKHALIGLTRALAAELEQRKDRGDVTVNAVCPGFVDTRIVAESAERLAESKGLTLEQAKARLGAMNPSGRLLTRDEVATAVLALVTESPGVSQGLALELGGA